MIQTRILLTALVLLLPLRVSAQARVWTVSPTGSDLGGGPFATIQRAIDAAADGDTVEVQPGHYSGPGNRDLDFRGKAISVRSRDPEDPECVRSTVIDARGGRFVVRFVHDEGRGTELAGFTMIGGISGPVGRGVPNFFEYSPGAHPRTRQLRVDDAGATAVRSASRPNWNVAPAASAKRDWNGLDPFHQPAATTDYYGSGDVDLDGRVTQTDVSLAQQMAAGTRPAVGRADVNGDGKVDAQDVQLLQAGISGTALPGWWNQLSTRDARQTWVQRLLAIDPTNHHPYTDGVFVCLQFATQLMSVFSSVQWDLQRTIYEGGQTSFNLPVYAVTISSATFGHSIDAVLIGDDPLNFSDWLFIEPQDDEFPSPGAGMPFGTQVAIGVPQEVYAFGSMAASYVVTFSLDQTGPVLVSHDPRLVLTRQLPGTVSPENRPNVWNPRVLGTGSGLLLFHRTRDDLSRVADLHVASFGTGASGSALPLTDSPQFSRNLDAFRGPDGRYHLLWYAGDRYTPGLFYGVFDPTTQRLSTTTRLVSATHLPRAARVITTATGELHVFWWEDQQQGSTSHYGPGIYWTKLVQGTWTGAQRLVSLPFGTDYPYTGNRESPRYGLDVTAAADGDLTLAWLGPPDMGVPNSSPTIMEMRYRGSWSQPSQIDAGAPFGSGGVNLATDAGGTIHLAYWLDSASSWVPNYPALGAVLYHRTRTASGSWSAPIRVDSQAAGQCPHLIAAGNSVYLVWERHLPTGVSAVWSGFDGQNWSTPKTLPAASGMEPWYPTGEALDDGRVAFAWSERSGDRVGIGTYATASQAPVLTSPPDGATAVSLTPTLTWNAASGATSYDVYLGTSASPPLAGNTAGTSYSPGALSPNTHYYWRAVAKAASGSSSSATWSFTTQIAAPVLVSPANGATGVSSVPTLVWNAVAGATSYDVYLGTQSSPPLAANVTNANYSPAALNTDALYYWRVAARDAFGSSSSPIWSFTTQSAAPVLLSPPDGAAGVSVTPTLAWSAAAGATSYDVHFGTAYPPPLATNTTGTSYAPAMLDPGRTYYWLVVAKTSGGASPSATWSFSTQMAPPTLLGPEDGAAGVSLTPTLSWSSPIGATSYDVYFGTSSSPPLVANIVSTNYQPGALSIGTVYYWRVVAKNAGGSASSGTWSFSVGIGAPALLSPANGAVGVSLTPTLTWSASAGATSFDVYIGTQASPPLVTNNTSTSYAPATLTAGSLYFWRVVAKDGASAASSPLWSFSTPVTQQPAVALRFVPVTPCRIADTRGDDGAFGGPLMAGGSQRSIPVPQSACNIPASAQAYSLNVTVVPQGRLGYLTLWPTGQAQPLVSTLNSFAGDVVANAAIVPAGAGGGVNVFVTDPTDVILDIDGYFDAGGGSNSYSFHPAAPCRIADTRDAGGPMGAGEGRSFAAPSSACGLPPAAKAYSLNVTAVPDPAHHYLGYLTTWPTGQPQPLVSTLNSWKGKVVANAALVPAGAGGAVSVFVTDPTDVILDTNGYFGAAGGAGALSFYPVAPCRVADTRDAAGSLGGPEMEAGSSRSFPVPSSACGIPASAAAYSLNVTVVPEGRLGYLTTWPAGQAQPLVSTLNSWDGSVVANAAIVPAGAGGAVNVFVTDRTHVVLDINGYFAP